MSRIRRREALSLRPVSQSYADPHSPLPFNSDSEGKFKQFV